MSYWDHAKPVRRTRAVAVADVARESAELMDEGGIEALTLRALAGRLVVAPPSLYSRIQSVDDLLDLALDHALESDPEIKHALAGTDHESLLMALHRHLCSHPWASRVLGLRAPRGPAYLRFSERLCVLLDEEGVGDPLSVAYAMSNFVIGSASTATSVASEQDAMVDETIAPTYAAMRRAHNAPAERIVAAGLMALRRLPETVAL